MKQLIDLVGGPFDGATVADQCPVQIWKAASGRHVRYVLRDGVLKFDGYVPPEVLAAFEKRFPGSFLD